MKPHQLHVGDARNMSPIADASVHLVVTSPPYPMVAMWDETFRSMDPTTEADLADGRGMVAFEKMHVVLDAVWAECVRTLVPGGLMCVNVGDAVRSVNGDFAKYHNAARVTTALVKLGMTPLPDILWKKPVNTPNKFMGSGTLPAGAYVTYEHEYILIFRKGSRRKFDKEGAARRARSSIFWEERNLLYSDLWDNVRGIRQPIISARERSGAYPLEIPVRLILMHSIEGDVVLDPFCGTGTTMVAAHSTCRTGVGFEVDPTLTKYVYANMLHAGSEGRRRTWARLQDHKKFLSSRKDPPKYKNPTYGVEVMTGYEVHAVLPLPDDLVMEGDLCWVNKAERIINPDDLWDLSEILSEGSPS